MAGLFDDDTPTQPTGPSLFGDPEPSQPVAVHAAAYRVLARTYRPVTFDDLIGQEAMVRTLRNAFATGRVAHAFMLTGVRGVGKTTTARIIARCLNCIGPDGTGGPTADPCGGCPNCRAILADRHPDVMEMDAASRTGVDDAREIVEATRYRPMQARAKVFIIDEVHMLSKSAFNALLKTLEEPPPHVKFVFATTELRKVPITVLSRCMRFDLRRISIAELARRFAYIADQEGVAIAPEALEMLARAADGSVRDGLSLLDQAIAQHDGPGEISGAAVSDMLGLADRGMVLDLLEAALGGRTAEALAITERAHGFGVDFAQVVRDLLDLVHTVTRLQTVPGLRSGPELPEAERVRGGALADRLSVPELARAWQILLKGVAEVETAPDRRAAAEMLLIRLAHVADLPTPGDLVRRLRAAPDGTGGSMPQGSGGGGGLRAVAGGGAVAQAAALGAPSPTSLREIATAVSASRAYPQLHAHLVHSVHLVRLVPGLIEFRPEPDAPRGLAAELGKFLLEHTGQRWTVAVSTEAGAPTLAQQAETADATRRSEAETHPLVRAILDAFPGAKLTTVEDKRADAYGLYAEPEMMLGGDDMPAFAPDDAEPADRMPD